MSEAIAGLDWDEGNIAKCRKHGVSVTEIEALFATTPLMVRPDVAHSTSETRFQAIGRTVNARWVFLIFTVRHRGSHVYIRPISARYMHRKEIEHYEQETDSGLSN